MNVFTSLYDLLFRDLIRVYRLLPYGVRFSVCILFLCMLVTAGLECIAITTLAFLGMSIASPQATAHHPVFLLLQRIFPFISSVLGNAAHFVLMAALVCLAIFALKNAFQAYVSWRTSVTGERISRHLGGQILHRFLYSPYRVHITSDSARMFQALSGKDQMSTLLIQLLNTHTYVITAIALFLTLLSSTPNVIFLAMASTAVAAMVVYRALKSKIDSAAVIMAKAQEHQQRALLSAMNGIREVLIYRQQPAFYDSYIAGCLEGEHSRSFLAMAPPIPTWILETVGVGIIPLSVWILAVRRGEDMATIASVISLVLLTAWRILPMVNRALSSLISVRASRPYALLSIGMLEEMMRQPSMELPPPDPNFTLERGIELKNVCFRYPNKSDDSLHDLSLNMPVGRQYGLVGVSGAGKSTLVAIISGLLGGSEGQFLVDGQPLDDPRLAAYMLQIGYVPQAPYILTGTIADNVAFSQWGQPIDEQRVLRACRMASLDIVENGKGIHAGVGERGAGLSGGQAQRVSLARALYCNPKVLILDEATSSLDHANEKTIMQAIAGLRRDMITIIVAHRLATVEQCDHIFWLDGGRLRMQGPPAVLLPLYKDFLDTRAQADCAAQSA